MSDLPFVSAVCVTGKTPWHVKYMLPEAVRCFKEQSYPGNLRELVIVYDCDDEPVRDAVIGIEGIQKVFVPVKKGTVLGDLRNAGLDAIANRHRKEPVMQWDDDDYHAPERMAVQVQALQEGPVSDRLPVLLLRQLAYDFVSDTAIWREFTNTAIHGTILHPPTDARYHAMAKEEDTKFLGSWRGFVCVGNKPELYVRFAHPHSTWGSDHTLRGYAEPWARGLWHLSDDRREFLRKVLERYKPAIAAMSDTRGGPSEPAEAQSAPALVL